MTIKEAIDELKAYNDVAVLLLHQGAAEDLIQAVEDVYKVNLPDDFKEFYRFSNGFETEEDIFNIIPLNEIIENKKPEANGILSFAEYMIYSDMWLLEINLNNCNDYKIFVNTDDNKLVLTNSLAEFIGRFLNGGVFNLGGLYDWQEEVAQLPIYTTKVRSAETLLTVFYHGIKHGIVKTQEVKDWADCLIMHEDEPEYFFIELSLSRDTNELLSLLYSVSVEKSEVVTRAILGLLYHRLSVGNITIETAVATIDNYNLTGLLTQQERAYVHSLTDDVWPDDQTIEFDELTQNLLAFLARYKVFEMGNYKNWHTYNSIMVYEIEDDFEEPPNQNAANKFKNVLFQQQVLKFVPPCIIALVSLIFYIVTYRKIASGIPFSKLQADLYQLSALYLTLFVVYCSLRGFFYLLERLKALLNTDN